MGFELNAEVMDCGDKPSKPPNISEIVSKFAKVCKFRSIGVLASENVNNKPHRNLLSNNSHVLPSFGEETSNCYATEEAGLDRENVHPLHVEVQDKGTEYDHLEISKLLDTIKALKLAYVQLQEAHIPYDPDKIRAADELVVSHLDALIKIKRAYKERQEKFMNSVSACSALLLAKIQVQETLLEKLKYQVKMKGNQVVTYRRDLQTLELQNQKLAKELKVGDRAHVKAGNIPSLDEIVKLVANSIHDFAKPLIALMKVSGWDLDQAANVIEDSVVYTKRSHKKYAFEAYIARRMFHGFTAQSCDVRHVMKYDDPIDALIEDPLSSFASYCRTKYLLIVHPKMEVSFFGSEAHRTLVTNLVHPHTPFYRAFVKMAKWVCILQAMTSSMEPKADIFRVKRGSQFSNFYMECVEDLKSDQFPCGEEQERFKVEFMVMPGFIIGKTLIRSRVYVSKLES